MTIHPLQRRNYNALLRRWHIKIIPAHRFSHAAIHNSLRHLRVFARLTEELYVDLDKFRKVWDAVVPFIRETVSPASVYWMRSELRSHYIFDTVLICCCIEVKI